MTAYLAFALMGYFVINAAIQVYLSRKRDAVKKLNKRMGIQED